MKKTFLIFIILIICFSAFAYVSSPYAHYMLGYVDSATDFSVSIFEEVLPFDLDNSDVAYNENYDTYISGLRIGTYSLISNTGGFEFYIAHTKLKLRDIPREGETGTFDEIDYRLYVIADYEGAKFLSAVSDSNASSADSCTNSIRIAGDNNDIWHGGASMCEIINQSIYISLDEGSETNTKNVIDNLKSGTYESTIYFLLKGQ